MADSKLRVQLIGDASKLTSSLNKATSKMSAFGKKAKQVGANLSLKLTLPIALAAGASIKLASDFQESLNKVDVSFGKSSNKVRDFAKTTLTQFGIAEGSALDMAALFGDMGTSMGITANNAANMSTSMVGLAGDLASFKNIGVAQATTALAGVFTGETESLKKLGIVMTEANLKLFAMDQGIQKNIKSMSQAEKVNLRYEYILSKTANSQGDFARTQDNAANQMRMFGQGLKQLGAEFGQILLPAFTKIVNYGNQLITKFTNLDDKTKKIIVVVGLFAAAIGPVLLALGSIITIAPAVGTALTVMMGPVGAIIAGLALIAYIIINNWKPIKKAVLDVANYFIDLYNESFGFRVLIESMVMTFKVFKVGVKTQMKIIYGIIMGTIKNLSKLFGNFGTILKGAFTFDSEMIKRGLADVAKTLYGSFEDIVGVIKTETDAAQKELFQGVKDGLANIAGLKTKIKIEADIETDDSPESDGDTGGGGGGGFDTSVDLLKLKEATNKALLTSDAKRFAAELKATTAHYDNLIKLNKGNADIVKQLETAKGEALATITKDSNQKKVDLMTEIYDASAVTDEQRKNLEIQNTKDYYQTLIDEAIKFDLATDALQTARDAKVKEIIDNYNEKTNAFKEIQAQLIGAMQGAFGALGDSIAQSLGMGESALGTFVGTLIQSAMAALSASLATSMGLSAVAATETAAASGPFAAFVLPALLAATAVAVKGVFGKIEKPKKFAKGGIVSTPTMGLMGEYPGARSNPEVIAPLDKLQKMFGERVGSSVQVGGEFVLKGQDLIVALQRANNNRNRII